MTAPRNTAGNLIYDPIIILSDLVTAITFFSEMFAKPFGVASYPDDRIIEVGDVGLHIYVDDEKIYVGQIVYQNDETEEVGLGDFEFKEKNYAIDVIIGAIAVTLHKAAGENRMGEALAVELGEVEVS